MDLLVGFTDDLHYLVIHNFQSRTFPYWLSWSFISGNYINWFRCKAWFPDLFRFSYISYHILDLFVELNPRTWKDAEGRLAFSMTYTSTTGEYKQWKIKMVFSEPVLFLDVSVSLRATSKILAPQIIVSPPPYGATYCVPPPLAFCPWHYGLTRSIQAHNAQDGTSFSDGHVWIVNPRSYNSYVSDGVLFGTAVAYANSTITPTG